MKNNNKLLKFIIDPDYRFVALAEQGLFNRMKDEEYIKRMYKAQFKCYPNLVHPQTYNEKLQWLKLHDHNPIYTKMVDKIEAKKVAASIVGEQYIIPTIGIWNSFDEIDFDTLPDQFVLKCTHDSGGISICKDKKVFDVEKAKRLIEKSLAKNYYWHGREWPYKNIEPRILAEKYLVNNIETELKDYKFFCFDGKVKALFIASDRQNPKEETKFDFFDDKYNHLPLTNGHPNAETIPEKPALFEEMKLLAGKLSEGVPHVRVDLYEANGKIYFGEMTLYHWSGFVPFSPQEWDYTFGSWLTLPIDYNT